MKEIRIICRCQDVTEDEIVEAIKKYDLKSVDEVKRVTRAGMGHCQGKTCRKLVEAILIRINGYLPDENEQPVSRPPAKAIPIKFIADSEEPFESVVERGRGGQHG
ncbi:(2Fe-2S)-binding protein [candidate division WOR-3 bacterium]|nr:(2Fe-2S)-binding protein [candidate division WOR-3 bacterium]